MRLTFVFTALLVIIETMQGASGQEDSTFDDIYKNSESSFFDQQDRFDWEDDFYQSFKGNQDTKHNEDQPHLWIDWSDIETEIVDIIGDKKDVQADEDEISADESDISFYTAKSRDGEDNGEASVGNRDDESDCTCDSDGESCQWQYDMIEEELSEDDEEEQVFNVTPDDFFSHVMGEMQKCLDADSDYDPSDDEGEFHNLSMFKGTLCTEIREAQGSTEEKIDIVEKKWQVLTQGEWDDFTDEQAVFDFIGKEVKESLISRETKKIEAETMKEEEKFLQL